MEVADALAPPGVGRVLLLTVMQPGPDDADAAEPEQPPRSLVAAQQVQREALAAALAAGSSPQSLLTIASSPWEEIERLAEDLQCESLLVGLSELDALQARDAALEQLLNEVRCDVAILRTHPAWRLRRVRRVLVPTGGKSGQVVPRARLLGSLARVAGPRVTFLQVLPAGAGDDEREDALHALLQLAADETSGAPEALVVRSDDVARAVAERAADSDLVVLGLQRIRGRTLFGDVALRIAAETDCAMVMISRGS